MKQRDATTYTKHHYKDHLLSEAEMLQKEYVSMNLQSYQPGQKQLEQSLHQTGTNLLNWNGN